MILSDQYHFDVVFLSKFDDIIIILNKVILMNSYRFYRLITITKCY